MYIKLYRFDRRLYMILYMKLYTILYTKYKKGTPHLASRIALVNWQGPKIKLKYLEDYSTKSKIH